jgi:hypothetical protein
MNAKEWQREINSNPMVRRNHLKVVNTRWQIIKTMFMIMGIVGLLFGTTLVMAIETNTIGINKDGVWTININFNVDLTEQMKQYLDTKIEQIVNVTS